MHHYWTYRNKRSINDYYEQWYANKLGNLDELDKFPERQTTKAASIRNKKPE